MVAVMVIVTEPLAGSEPFQLTVLVATVATAVDATPELVEDGVHGLLADFYDVDGLAERALRVLRDPAGHAALGQAARARVLERYDKRVCFEQLAGFFEEVAGKGR